MASYTSSPCCRCYCVKVVLKQSVAATHGSVLPDVFAEQQEQKVQRTGTLSSSSTGGDDDDGGGDSEEHQITAM